MQSSHRSAARLCLRSPRIASAQTPSWTVPPESAALPVQMGRGRRARLRQPDEAASWCSTPLKLVKTGEIIELAHVLGPSMPFFGTRRFDMHIKRTFMNTGSNERGIERRDGALRDRAGRHPVRRLRAPEPPQQPLQLLQDRGDRGPRPVQQARHPPGRRLHHARRADRRRGLQGRRYARRQLRGDGRGSRRRAEEAEHHAEGGRRRHHPHRLGQDLRQGERALCEVLPRPRREGRAVDHRQEPDPARRRQLAGRGRRPIPIRRCRCRCISSRWW